MVERGIIMLEPINFVTATTSEEKRNLFEGMLRRRYDCVKKETVINNYKPAKITSIMMDEYNVNGITFIVRYDRCNDHTLTILDMVNDGYFVGDPNEEHKMNVGATVISLSLDEIPSILRNRNIHYSKEIIAIMKDYYKKYHDDIVRFM